MTHTLPITKARKDLTKIVENARKKLDEYVITVNGSPAAVIISAEEYESWKETNEIMSDPKLVKAIKQGEKEKKELNNITKLYKKAVSEAINELKESPFIGKPLTRELTKKYSYRIGVYRLIYKIHKRDKKVSILSVGHRSTIYK